MRKYNENNPDLQRRKISFPFSPGVFQNCVLRVILPCELKLNDSNKFIV